MKLKKTLASLSGAGRNSTTVDNSATRYSEVVVTAKLMDENGVVAESKATRFKSMDEASASALHRRDDVLTFVKPS